MKYVALSIFIALLLILFSHEAVSQNNDKVVKSIKELEANLKGLIQKEAVGRKIAYAELSTRHARAWLNGEKEAEKIDTAGEKHHGKINTKELIKKLKAGNERFIAEKLGKKQFGKLRAELAKGQQPYTIILSCSDLRVPPEYIFDESLGQLFIIRVAGNVVDSAALGSIEYAAEHLQTHLIVVMGHSGCGAVKATVGGGVLPSNIASFARRITPAVDRIKLKKLNEQETIAASVKENVYEQIQQASHRSTLLHELLEKHEVAIIGAVYDLESGKVDFLSDEQHE